MNEQKWMKAIEWIDDDLIEDVDPDKKEKKPVRRLFWAIPAAAIIFIALSVAGFASGTIPLPGFLSSLLKIEDTEQYAIIRETQTANGYAVTFEGIIKGTVTGEEKIQLDLNTETAFTLYPKDSLTAVFTVARTDGAPVEDDVSFTLDALLLVDGYVSQVFYPKLSTGLEVTEDGKLHVAVQINPYEVLADRGLHIALLTQSPAYIDTVLRADRETGEFYFVEGVDGPKALFDLPLDPAYADTENGDKLLRSTAWALDRLEDIPDDYFAH